MHESSLGWEVACPNMVVGMEVAGRMGIGHDGFEVVPVTVWFLVERGVGKKSVSVGVRRQVACMAGTRIVCIRSWLRNAARPFSIAVRTNSTGRLIGERLEVAMSDCLCVGTKRMCPVGMWMRVDMLPWPLTAVEFHGVASHTGSIKTTRIGISMHSKEASAWITASSMSSGSYSGLVM